MSDATPITVREHGSSGPTVIVLHGGPGAPGSAGAIARGLAGAFRVLEPWQRASDGSAGGGLTVARHVADLHEIIASRAADEAPPLVGESWGAMLALAYAAAHPESAGRLALVGCGTWDVPSRAEIARRLDARLDPDLRRRLDALDRDVPDPLERMAKRFDLTHRLYDFDPVPLEPDEGVPPFDVRGNRETWDDMLLLQRNGTYPSAFRAVRSPVLMLHGAWDPHPGRMIFSSLKPFIPHLEYREWERYGHRPWAERGVREEFFGVLSGWLAGHAGAGRRGPA